MLAAEKEVCKLVLLLTGAIEGSKREVQDYLQTFHEYEYFWVSDMQREYSNFLKTNPLLEDFDDELGKYVKLEETIKEIQETKVIGVLGLENTQIKQSLCDFAQMWKAQFSKNLLEISRKELE